MHVHFDVYTEARSYIKDITCTHTHTHTHKLMHTELQKKPVEGFSAGLVDDDDLYKWEVIVMGPPDTY